MTIESWLSELGLSQYLPAFQDNDITPPLLIKLTGSDLVELGVASVGHRRIMLDAIAAMAGDGQGISVTQRRQITVLFCDIVGSTTLSEMLDAEDMGEVLCAYHDVSKAVLVKYGAYIANFMADGVMAYFGYPMAREDDALRAVRASQELLAVLRTLKTPAGPGLNVRMGLDTGVVVVGDIGPETTMGELSAVGKTSNRAARIQALAQAGDLLVSERTYEFCKNHFEFEPLGEQTLKGIHQQTGVWRVLDACPPTDASLATFVGRENELATLRNAWRAVVEGHGGCITITGSPGLGKTRLGQILRSTVEAASHPVFHFADIPIHSGTAYHTLLTPLFQAQKISSADGVAVNRKKLAAALNVQADDNALFLDHLITSLTGVPVRDEPQALENPTALRDWIFGRIKALLEKTAQDAPVLIILDDAQWADPSSVAFFESHRDWFTQKRILFVAMTRPEWTPPWPASAGDMTLGGLSTRESEELITALMGNQRVPEQLLGRMIESCDGVPLYLEEVTRDLMVRLHRKETKASPHEYPVPRTLVEAITARLDDLGEARWVAQYASAIGRDFDFCLLLRITELESEALHAALQTLMDADIIRTKPWVSEDHYGFCHMLVRQTAYETMLRSHRRDLHSKISDALMASGQQRPPHVVASHLDRANRSDEAAAFWLTFAERQIGLGGYAEALKALYAIREKLAPMHDKSEQLARTELKILSALGSTLLAVRPTAADEIGEVYEEAYGLAKRISPGPEVGFVLFGLAAFFFFQGAFSRVEALTYKLALLGRELGHTQLTEGARMIGGQVAFWRGDHVAFQRDHPPFPLKGTIPDGKTVARFAQDKVVTSRITFVWSLNLTGRWDLADEESHAAMRYATQMHHPYTLSQAQQIMAWHHVVRRQPAEALHYANAMLETSRRHNFKMFRDIGEIVRLWAEGMLDPAANPCAELNALLQRCMTTGGHLLVNAGTALLAELALAREEYNLALNAIEAALVEGRSEDRVHIPELLRLKGEVLMAQSSSFADGEPALREALELAQDTGSLVFALRAATGLVQAGCRELGFLARVEDLLESLAMPLSWSDSVEARRALHKAS
ncbi:MAG: adenylate/guanylate cyclase domain-containing protein [Pseudomonadota bacterium]